MNLEHLASIEWELIKRNMALYPRQYGRIYGTLSPSTVVVSGYAGHLFIFDGGNAWEQQLNGNLRLSPDDLQRWLLLLRGRSAMARDFGVHLAHVIVPEKQIVLPGFRWKSEIAPDLSNRPVLQICAVADTDFKIIYPAKALVTYQSWCELFWRGNSHWCASGCIIAARSILEALFDDTFPDESIPLERTVMQHDLFAHFSEDVAFEEVICVRPAGDRIFDNNAFKQTGQHTGSHFVLRNVTAPIKEALVIFGDSYACDMGLTAALSAFFFDVHFVWSKDILWNYIRQVGAKYALWESAERFLIKVPGGDPSA